MKDPNHTDYEHWVRRLYATNMFHPVKLGLQNMKQLHSLLGNPMDQMDKVKVIHVAGTNGKGSVCLKIANTLQNYTSSSGQNRKVGLFCSPHVSSFRERMQVNGVPISEKQVVDLLPKLYKLCREHDIPATFFELTTALAFSFFDEEGCDVVVLETGLGGRLDATNVVQNPALTCITSIGLEHTRILGDTVELIAREKAGILKRGRPVVCGPDVPHETILECAKEVGAGRYYLPDTVLETQIDRKITDYDVQNQRISKACLTLFRDMYPEIAGDLTDEAMDKGVIIRPPCRFEEIKAGNGVNVILDVAHNPQAMEYLVDKVKATYPDSSFRFVIGMSSDKDLKQCGDSISTILSSPSSIHLIQAAHPRAATVEAILDANPSWKEQANYDLEDRSITKQVHTALEVAAKSNEILIVCGSVFVMAEAREAIGIEEPRDSDFISEMAGAGARHGQENFGNTPTSDDEEDTKTT
jgi:dihydrofolate synthase / folylpolyglutamate synthase